MHDEWDQQMEDYANEHGLLYINFLDKIDEIGIDWNTDTYDQGLHLNVYGAEKLSHYFGQILSEQLGVADHRSDTEIAAKWEQKCETYMKRKESLEKELETVVE